MIDSGVRLIHGRVPLTPEQLFLGIAPVEFRERPSAAAALLATQVNLESAEDSRAVMSRGLHDAVALATSLTQAVHERHVVEEGFRAVKLSSAKASDLSCGQHFRQPAY